VKIYPNLYLMLVAGTTFYRKSTAYKLAEQVARAAIPHMLMLTPGSPERFQEALAEEIASGEWVDIPGIGKVQISREEGKGYVTSITTGGQRIRRKVQMRLRTKIRLYEQFKWRCRVHS
jgi:hypothetical protein